MCLVLLMFTQIKSKFQQTRKSKLIFFLRFFFQFESIHFNSNKTIKIQMYTILDELCIHMRHGWRRVIMVLDFDWIGMNRLYRQLVRLEPETSFLYKYISFIILTNKQHSTKRLEWNRRFTIFDNWTVLNLTIGLDTLHSHKNRYSLLLLSFLVRL